jgi:hypothetical protein
MKGIPARYLPPEFQAETRMGKRTIDLSLLRQTPPSQYLIDSGDVLGVYIEGVLGRREDVPPVYFPERDDVSGTPSLGYPIPVREDGTLSIPMIEPLYVRGMTIRQVEETVRKAYTIDREILKPGRDRILISMQKPRTYRVLVIRQEAGNEIGNAAGGAGQLNLGTVKRGTGRVVSLPAYKNDVLHALAETGGLPGLDAENAIYIIRRGGPESCQLPPIPAPNVGPALAPSGTFLPSLSTGTEHQNAVGGIQLAANATESGAGWGHSVVPAVGKGPQSAGSTWGWTPATGHRTAAAAASSAPISGPRPIGGAAPAYSHQGGLPHENWAAPVEQPFVAGGVLPPEFAGQSHGPMAFSDATVDNSGVVKIPIRLARGEAPHFNRENIILRDGDIVFIESRETEIFYTGGLLGGGQFTLPRDYDLDVLGAVSIAESQGQSGSARSIGGVSALNNDVSISASNVIIVRQLPNGTQVPIKVDLYQAIRNPRERILIQPGDYVLLQYTRLEAFFAFIERHLLEGALFSLAASQVDSGSGQ